MQEIEIQKVKRYYQTPQINTYTIPQQCSLAKRARDKLIKAAEESKYKELDLRILVGHANFLDCIMDNIDKCNKSSQFINTTNTTNQDTIDCKEDVELIERRRNKSFHYDGDLYQNDIDDDDNIDWELEHLHSNSSDEDDDEESEKSEWSECDDFEFLEEEMSNEDYNDQDIENYVDDEEDDQDDQDDLISPLDDNDDMDFINIANHQQSNNFTLQKNSSYIPFSSKKNKLHSSFEHGQHSKIWPDEKKNSKSLLDSLGNHHDFNINKQNSKNNNYYLSSNIQRNAVAITKC